MSYTNVFGGTTLYPSDVSYLALTLTGNVSLSWPLESGGSEYPAARVIDVTASALYDVTLPDATLTGAGQTILFNCLPASTSSFRVKDFAGNVVATVAVGEQWQLYLAGTATSAGVWRAFRFGASTATVQPSALAGYGLTVTGGNLSQSTPLTTFNSSPRTVLTTDRASLMLWNGTGSGTLNLPPAATAGNNFLVSAHNSGGGDLTVAAAGSELIDGGSTLVLHPGDSTTFVTDGLAWYTLGLGQQAVFAFDYTSIAVTGGTYTLSGSELNRIAYQFVGALSSNVDIVVPATVQQYWVTNATTGPFNLFLKTATGTRVAVAQGARGIYYCNGINVVDADTSTISLPVNPSDGGTGMTSYTTGDLVYASGPSTLNKLAGVAVGNVLLSGGVGAAPAYGKVGLATHVSGTLPVANGGTGVATAPANGQLLIGNGAGFALANITAGSGISISNSAGGITITATGGGGSVTSVQASGGTTGLSFTGGPITGAGTLTLGGTLALASGGTGATTAAGARTALDVPSTTGAGASGTWGISISGNAATATNAGNVTGTVAIANGGTGATTASAARTALGVPDLTGAGASGTWGINISGNAATATNATNATTATNQSGGSVNATTGSFSGVVSVGANLNTGGAIFPGTNAQNIAADTTTLYLRGANVAWQDAAATTTRMYLSGNGRLGIGTTGPIYRLDAVSDDTATGFVARLRGPATGAAEARLQFTDNSASAEWGNIRATVSGMTLANPSTFTVDTAGSNRFSINSAGNVGVGTISPDARFTIQDGGAGQITLKDSGGTTQGFVTTSGAIGTAPANSLRLRGEGGVALGALGQLAMFVTTSANVGIGTTSPGSPLVVRRDQAAVTDLNVLNASTNALAASQLSLSTGTSNSFVTFNVVNANYRAISNGPAITSAFDDSDNHSFRTNAGVVKFSIDAGGNITSARRAAAVGYRGLPSNGTSGAYTLVLNDMGQMVSANNTVTIPTNATAAFDVGSAITILNYAAGNITVSPAGGVTLVLAGTTTTGARTLAQNALVTLVKTGTDSWIITGAGVS